MKYHTTLFNALQSELLCGIFKRNGKKKSKYTISVYVYLCIEEAHYDLNDY